MKKSGSNGEEIVTLGAGGGGGNIDTGSFATTGSNLFLGNQRIDGGTSDGFGSGIKFINSGYAHYTAGISGSTFVIADTSAQYGSVWPSPSIKLQIGETSSLFDTNLQIIGNNGNILLTPTVSNPNNAIQEIHANDDYPWIARFFNDTYSNTSSVMSYFGWSDGRFVFHNDSTQSIGLQVNGYSAENGLLIYPNKVAFVNNIEVTGSINAPNITGSLFGTASWAENVLTSSYVLNAISASYATTASYAMNGGINIDTSSFATTGSNLFIGNQTITGSIIFDEGARITSAYYGNTYYGAIDIVAGQNGFVELASYNSQSYFWVDDYGAYLQTSGSYYWEFNNNGVFTAPGRIVAPSFTGSLFGTASWAENVLTASYVVNAISASYATSASYAATAGNGLVGGVNNYVPVWTGVSTLTTSSILQSGSNSIIINSTVNTISNPEALYVQQTHPTSFNVISGKGNLNNYLQLNIHNTNAGTSVSSDVVATANNGDENGNYIDMGINGSNFSGSIGNANDAYLYSTGSHLHIGNASPNMPLQFFVGGTDTDLYRKFELNTNNSHNITGSLEISGSLTVNQGITGSLFGTASWANNVLTASYASTASYVSTAQTASYVLNAVSASYASTASFVTGSIFTNSNSAASASYALTASYAMNGGGGGGTPGGSNTQIQFNRNGAFSGSSALTFNSGSNTLTLTGSLNITGSTTQTGNNTLIGNTVLSGSIGISGSSTIQGTTTMTGSLLITGSTTQVGTNTLLGNTILSGSILISGSYPIGSFSSSVNIYGDTSMTGYLRFNPQSTNIDTSLSASYIFVSGSTQDLYFSQNGSGYSNVTRLRWLESSLYTGILKGGILSSTPGTTTFTVTSGSGLIVSLNASTASDPFPTSKQISWNTQTLPIKYSGSAKITYVGIDGTGTIVQQTDPWGSIDIDQWDTQINLGTVLTLSGSVSTGVFNAPQVSYGIPQQTDDFIRAFGPLKISGHTLQASGSSPTLSIIKSSGTAYKGGANYVINPNHPSTVSENAINTSKIYRYYLSGSTPIIDTGIGNAGYTNIDSKNYVDTTTGTLALVGGAYWSIQRVFWIPNSPTNAFIVYYGNDRYRSLVDATNAKDSEPFIEAPNTAQNAIFIGYIVIQGGGSGTPARDLLNASEATIIPGGLFRNVGGVGSSGTTPISTTLASLSDVALAGLSKGDLLVYGAAGDSQWNNAKQLTGSYGLTGSLAITQNITAASFTGSLFGTASFVTGSIFTNSNSAASASYASTASYVLTAQTASYVVTAQTASYVLNAISASYATLAQTSNTASYVVTAQTASYVLNAISASYATLAQTSNTASYVVTAQTASYVLNAISASFATSATSATTATTASYAQTLTIQSTLTDFYAVTPSTNAGVNNLFTKNTGSYTSAFGKYTAYSGSNSRAGEFMTSWNGTTTTYTDIATTDIGSTSTITFTSAIVTGQIQINTGASTPSGWQVKMLATFI
jgi:hypothetical protein